MAYKNTNKNKDKYPWMGQRFRDGKKQRKVFLTRRESLLWESQEEDGEEKAKEPVAEPTLSVSLQTWANEYLEYSKNKFVKKTLNEKVLSFRFFLKIARLLPSDFIEKLSHTLRSERCKKFQSLVPVGRQTNTGKTFPQLGNGDRNSSICPRKTPFQMWINSHRQEMNGGFLRLTIFGRRITPP